MSHQHSHQPLLSSYDLSCGYVQEYKSDSLQEQVQLSRDEHKTCYWVWHYRTSLGLAIGYINYKQSYPTLTSARKAYNLLQRDIKSREAHSPS